MRTVTDECCVCVTENYPCRGDSCSNRHCVHYYCDRCKDEFNPEDLYQYGGEEICANCLLEDYGKIEVD